MDCEGAKNRLRQRASNDEMLFEIYKFTTENESTHSEHIKCLALNKVRRLGLTESDERQIIDDVVLILFN